jgi:hypothetical protein
MKRKDILSILVPLFIFVIVWIGFSILHNIATSTISETISMQILPIVPNFDTKIISDLKKRPNVATIYPTTIPVQNIVIPTATPSAATPSPTLTPTVTIQPTPTSSPSAETATAGGSLSQ